MIRPLPLLIPFLLFVGCLSVPARGPEIPESRKLIVIVENPNDRGNLTAAQRSALLDPNVRQAASRLGATFRLLDRHAEIREAPPLSTDLKEALRISAEFETPVLCVRNASGKWSCNAFPADAIETIAAIESLMARK